MLTDIDLQQMGGYGAYRKFSNDVYTRFQSIVKALRQNNMFFGGA